MVPNEAFLVQLPIELRERFFLTMRQPYDVKGS